MFKSLDEVYGDKTPVSIRLREFYDHKQITDANIKTFAYDLQGKLSRIRCRDPDPDLVLEEQFVLSLRDDTLLREPTPSFTALMQAAIDWSEEEEAPSAISVRGPGWGTVVSPALSLQSLQS